MNKQICKSCSIYLKRDFAHSRPPIVHNLPKVVSNVDRERSPIREDSDSNSRYSINEECSQSNLEGTLDLNLEFPSDQEASPSPTSLKSTPQQVETERDICFETESLSNNDPMPEYLNTSTPTLSIPIKSCISSQNKCCVCGNKNGRSNIPKEAVMDAFITHKIFIPYKNRICPSHLFSNHLSNEAKQLLVVTHESVTWNSEQVFSFINSLASMCARNSVKKPKLDFDNDYYSDDDYHVYTGLTKKEHFDNLLQFCVDLRASSNRSVRNALAIFLVKLRLDISQRAIGNLFGIRSQKVVSETISAVGKCLENYFVKKYLGFENITREQIINQHTVKIVNKLFQLENNACVIMDGTYLYIEKASNFTLQKKTYSTQKHSNLVKPHITCATDGYIIDTDGLFCSDPGNNDAQILLSRRKEPNSFFNNFNKGDLVILDRGYRDAKPELERMGFKVAMPCFLPQGKKQFSTAEANESRKVTMVRFVVESVNGRLKNVFKFFKNDINIQYLPHLHSWLRIACTIFNMYFPPLFTQDDDHDEIADIVLSRMGTSNVLQERLESQAKVKWIKMALQSLPDFPTLSEKDMRIITLGIYQSENAPLYAAEHVGDEEFFELLVCRADNYLIKGKINLVTTKKMYFLVMLRS